MSSTTHTRTLLTALGYCNKKTGELDLEKLKIRSEAIGRGKTIEAKRITSGKIIDGIISKTPSYSYTVTTRKGNNWETTTTLEIEDIDALKKYNVPAVKIYDFILQKALEKYGENINEMQGEIISFHLKELVSCGMYANKSNARRGFKTAEKALRAISIGGTEKHGKIETKSITAQLFITTGVIDGTAVVKLHPDINWGLICREYALAPEWRYGLSYNAYRMLSFIFAQARRNIGTLIKNGGISVSVKALIRELNLPDPKETKNPKKDIKQPLFKAIEEINNADTEVNGYSFSDIRIIPKTGIQEAIQPFIENGMFFAKIGDEYVNCFSSINSNRNAKIEKAKRAKQKRESGEKG